MSKNTLSKRSRRAARRAIPTHVKALAARNLASRALPGTPLCIPCIPDKPGA